MSRVWIDQHLIDQIDRWTCAIGELLNVNTVHNLGQFFYGVNTSATYQLNEWNEHYFQWKSTAVRIYQELWFIQLLLTKWLPSQTPASITGQVKYLSWRIFSSGWLKPSYCQYCVDYTIRRNYFSSGLWVSLKHSKITSSRLQPRVINIHVN